MAEGSRGRRTYRFSARRVRITKRRKPGEELWAIWRCNLDGSEPRYYLSNAPEDTPLETLAYVGGSRWRIETEFEFGRPRKPRLRSGQRRTMAERADAITEEAWREIAVAEGSQGPRSYLFSAQRVRPTSRRKPGEIHWAIYRRNLDGSEPRYYLSNAPEDTPLETLAYVGGSRWRIETEFETERSDVGLDEYETRTPYQVRGRLWAGWHHHVALCLLGGAFLLSLQQAWGEKDAPDHEAAGLPGGAGNAAPGTVRT